VMDRAWLADARKAVEDAVKRAEALLVTIDTLLRQLHELRRSNRKFDRRRGER